MSDEPDVTLAALKEGPPTVPLWPTACRACGLGRTRGFELAKRGEFPVRVLRLGRRYSVPTAELIRHLGGDREDVA
jgi:hypothetical protein